MKVLHINRNYLTSQLHQTMLDHLSGLGVDNEVFAPTDDKNKCIINPNRNVTICECFNNIDRYFYYLKQKKIYRAAVKSYDLSKFDCIHAYTLFTDGNVAMNISNNFHIPYVVAVRNADVNDFFKKAIFLRKKGVQIMEWASAICFLSESYKKTVFDKYVPENKKDKLLKKTYVIPNGIDDFWHKNSYLQKNIDNTIERIDKKELKVIYVGNIDKNKNLTDTCDAIEILKNKGWQICYTVVGKILSDQVYRAVKPHIEYKFPATKKCLIKYYRNSDIFVMPSHSETFGLVYAEALSQKLPVIYTRGQGFDGQFRDSEVGYSVSDNNPNELANVIELCAKNYEQIANRCIQASEVFDWNQICKKYIDIYSQSLC